MEEGKKKKKRIGVKVSERFPGESFAQFSRRVERAKARELTRQSMEAAKIVQPKEETNTQAKKKRRREKLKERRRKKLLKRRGSGVKRGRHSSDEELYSEEDDGQANSATSSKRDDASNGLPGIMRKKKQQRIPSSDPVAFGEVAERPPEFKLKPKIKRTPLATECGEKEEKEDGTDGGHVTRGDDDDGGGSDESGSDSEGVLREKNKRMTELMRSRAILAYKMMKKKRRAQVAMADDRTASWFKGRG
eukprot:CAMPEP_0184497444 /NCGR_PEP_ID=MMETSP0113_2-20130426/36579_1 /TAXON_ID=91329 /ORGANISM="Norrisiella sphaerica, Strain BC52" /LENGTH=247 /DNA_ID=CAMNT_0026884553 /DNA_START=267 /DNA_END=1011 /DNA_ORIENTATION=-